MTAVKRPLTDNERTLMCQLAVHVVADQTGCEPHTAAAVLDAIADENEVYLRGDTEDAYLEASGNLLVHAKRDWLAFHAEHPEAINLAKHARTIPHDDEGTE